MGKRASREAVEQLIAQIARDIAKLDPVKVILFGSLARGDYHEASDIDLLVIKETDVPFLRRGLEVLEAVEARAQIEPFVYTPDEVDRMIADGNPLILDALSEGRVIYERR